jgi:putative PIN family toxin of toxin-antitoxin system
VTPRVVLDSNVIVSGLGWSGTPARILDAALDGQLVLVTSPPLLAELRRVLEYPKLAKVIGRAQQLVDVLEASSTVILPTRVLAVVGDESDNRVLEAAVDGAAHYVVSGDDDLLGLRSFQGIPIVAPGEFAAQVLDL